MNTPAPGPEPNGEELKKVVHDTVLYGEGFMKDGKHVPHEDVYREPSVEEQAKRLELWIKSRFKIESTTDLYLMLLEDLRYRERVTLERAAREWKLNALMRKMWSWQEVDAFLRALADDK